MTTVLKCFLNGKHDKTIRYFTLLTETLHLIFLHLYIFIIKNLNCYSVIGIFE